MNITVLYHVRGRRYSFIRLRDSSSHKITCWCNTANTIFPSCLLICEVIAGYLLQPSISKFILNSKLKEAKEYSHCSPKAVKIMKLQNSDKISRFGILSLKLVWSN